MLTKDSIISDLTTNLQNSQDRATDMLSVIENLSQTSKQAENSGELQHGRTLVMICCRRFVSGGIKAIV